MGKSFKELKEISQGLADLVGVSYDVAASVVASFSAVGEWDHVDAIAGGDMNTIKEGFKRAGAVLPEPEKIPKKKSRQAEKRPTKEKNIKADQYKTQRDIVKPSTDQITPEAVGIIEKYNDLEYVRGELPAGLADDIKAFIKAWADANDIEDITKCDGLQWRAACLYVGEWIKSKGILYDREAIRARGGRQYDGEKVLKLLEIFQAIAATYKKVPIHTDFISFSGISRQWFFDYEGRGLTSSSVQIVKKCIDMEKAATSAKLLNSNENPLKIIWYEKSRFGYRDNDNIQQIDEKHGSNNNALPVFDLPKLQ